MEDARSRADKFDLLYTDLKDKVESQEKLQADQEPIHSEVDAVKQQMEEYKVQGGRVERGGGWSTQSVYLHTLVSV